MCVCLVRVSESASVCVCLVRVSESASVCERVEDRERTCVRLSSACE